MNHNSLKKVILMSRLIILGNKSATYRVELKNQSKAALIVKKCIE